MSSRPWTTEELDAGDARRLQIEYKPSAGNTDIQRAAYAAASAGGDLEAAAARLGVDLADLVRIRREIGLRPGKHRVKRIAGRLRWLR